MRADFSVDVRRSINESKPRAKRVVLIFGEIGGRESLCKMRLAGVSTGFPYSFENSYCYFAMNVL